MVLIWLLTAPPTVDFPLFVDFSPDTGESRSADLEVGCCLVICKRNGTKCS